MQRAIHHTAVSSRATPLAPSADALHLGFEPAIDAENSRLAAAIKQRIESRLPGRVRNLAVRVHADTVVLEGQCATYYTKQIAQHAALGILEDEHLENAIVVAVGR